MEKIVSIYCAAQASNRRYPRPGSHIGEESRRLETFQKLDERITNTSTEVCIPQEYHSALKIVDVTVVADLLVV